MSLLSNDCFQLSHLGTYSLTFFMLIGIDASRANKPQKTGVEWYAYHLIEQFKKMDKDNRYFLYTNVPLRGKLSVMPENFEEKLLSWPIPRSWTVGRLSWEMKMGKEVPEVLFVPAHTIPLFNPARSVVTIHDLGFEHFPEVYHWADKLYHRLIINFIKKFATKIIAVSEFTKRDIMKIYGVPEQKIAVVHNGYDQTMFHPRERDDLFLKKYNLNFPYVFFVGRLESKKNVARLVEAFAMFKLKHKSSKHKLVLAGSKAYGKGYEAIEENIKRFNLDQEVIMPGWVSDDDLPKFLAQAEALAFPSLFEGFGIPIIEAMASGCPVICSGTTCLPEVAGGAALLFDPESPDDMMNKLEEILLNKESRVKYQAKGLARAKDFSWEKCAAETLAVLMEK